MDKMRAQTGPFLLLKRSDPTTNRTRTVSTEQPSTKEGKESSKHSPKKEGLSSSYDPNFERGWKKAHHRSPSTEHASFLNMRESSPLPEEQSSSDFSPTTVSPIALSPLSSPGTDRRFSSSDAARAEKSLTQELKETLENPKKVVLFKSFLEKEFCSETLNFWLDAEQFRTSTSVDVLKEADDIFQKYFSENATQQVNIDADILNVIQEKLKSADRAIYEDAQERIFDLLKTDSFRKFRRSTFFFLDVEEPDIFNVLSMSEDKDRIKNKELNMVQNYTGEEVKSNVWQISATLLNAILRLYRKHTAKSKDPLFYEAEEGTMRNKALESIATDLDYKRFCGLTMQLQKVRLVAVSNKERLVFFLNIYNTLCLHALVELEPCNTLSQKIEFFKKAQYRIGNDTFSLMDIEHCVLRAPMSKASIIGIRVSMGPRFSKQDPRMPYVITEPEPLINFALYNITPCSAYIAVYTPNTLGVKLVQCTSLYLKREHELVNCDSYGTKPLIKLPKILQWYLKDFAPSEKEKDMLSAILPYFSDEIRTKIKFFLATMKIKFKDFNWAGASGYMGVPDYDPADVEEEIKQEFIQSVQSQIVEVARQLEVVKKGEDQNLIGHWKSKLDELTRLLL